MTRHSLIKATGQVQARWQRSQDEDGVTSAVKECRLCGILMLRDKINDIPGIGTRVNKNLRWGGRGMFQQLCNKAVWWGDSEVGSSSLSEGACGPSKALRTFSL